MARWHSCIVEHLKIASNFYIQSTKLITDKQRSDITLKSTKHNNLQKKTHT